MAFNTQDLGDGEQHCSRSILDDDHRDLFSQEPRGEKEKSSVPHPNPPQAPPNPQLLSQQVGQVGQGEAINEEEEEGVVNPAEVKQHGDNIPLNSYLYIY